jgi:Cys-tRNA(Pro)/Cys-tRNA(Cys) deacylase
LSEILNVLRLTIFIFAKNNMKKTNALRILDQHKIDYKTLEYKYDSDNLDVAKIAEDNGLLLEIIFKTLVLNGDKSGTIMAIIPGDRQLSLKKTAAASGNKKVEMAAVNDLENLTGYVRGGCSPIGTKKAYPVYLDLNAKVREKIFINAGTRGLLFSCAPNDLFKVCKVEWADLCE